MWASAGLRLTLVIWGEFQDHAMQVPYTDIDYVSGGPGRGILDGFKPMKF